MSKQGRVLRELHITRKMVRERRGSAVFIFGDNIARVGFGGQAAEMRGEPNTVGVPTKWGPASIEIAYFKDDDWDYPGVRIAIEAAFVAIRMYLDAGYDVVIPADGLGTGRAQLRERAPRIAREIDERIEELSVP